MTIVYAVTSSIDYAGETLLGIYTTQDAAVAAVAAKPDNVADDYEIYPVTLDQPPSTHLANLPDTWNLARQWRERAAARLVERDSGA